MNVPVAAIDVGTNSIHMVIASVDHHGFKVLATEKQVVRLGEGAQGQDKLSDQAIERALIALKQMRQIAESRSAMIRAVATSAVREAENRDVFIDAVLKEAGIKIEVISGSEEARLIHLGVSRSLNLNNDSVLTVDIGGGSTEFCVSVQGELKFAQSVKIGAVRMTEAYLHGGVSTEKGVKELRSRLRSALAPLAQDLAQLTWNRVILSSGTNETIAKMISCERDVEPPTGFNGFVFTSQELDLLVKEVLVHRSPEDRDSMPGLDPKRADIIPSGVVILQEIARALNISEFEYSEFALREGLLIDTAQRLGVLEAASVDPGISSAIQLATRCSVDLKHGLHVAQLASLILNLIAEKFDIDVSLERLLRASALLARVGNVIAYSKYHLHSYYIIRNADLTGFSVEEIEVIALTARYHRKGFPRASHDDFSRLSEDRQHDVELLAGILRIASGLDRSHDQCVKSLSLVESETMLTFAADTDCSSEELVELNLFTAQSRVAMLEEFLGDKIVLRQK